MNGGDDSRPAQRPVDNRNGTKTNEKTMPVATGRRAGGKRNNNSNNDDDDDQAAAAPPPAPEPPPLLLNGTPLKRVSEFRYLGRIVTDTNDDDRAAAVRMQIAESTFRKCYRQLLRGRLSSTTKLKMWDAVMAAQVLYGCESWTNTKWSRRRLDRMQQRHLRNLLGMNPVFLQNLQRIHYPSVDDVLARAARPRLSDLCDFATLRFAGHVWRRPAGDDCLFLMGARIPGLVGLVKARRTLVDRIGKLTREAGLSRADAATRTVWRKANKARLAARFGQAASDAAGSGATGTAVPALAHASRT